MTHDFETCVICPRGEEEAGTLSDENAQAAVSGLWRGTIDPRGPYLIHCRAGAGSAAHWGIGSQRLWPPDGREPAGIPPEVELNDGVEGI